MAESKYNKGIWLTGSREWATLPPRLCKPTPHNCDDVPALHQHAEQVGGEVLEIDKATLHAMRKEYK